MQQRIATRAKFFLYGSCQSGNPGIGGSKNCVCFLNRRNISTEIIYAGVFGL